ncbi:MAG: hypothetical protein NTX22_13405 [Ignavibacteriales bacterium]|nr:hypothetical protein [Ignavibacteriales bacterium]
MKNINKLFLSIQLLSLILISNSTFIHAQFSGSVNYSLLYDNNPFKQQVGSEEFVNSVSTYLSYQPFDKEFYLFYSANLNAFQNISDRFYQYHSLGTNYSFVLGDGEADNIFMGAGYNLKRGTLDYSIYDYNQFTAYINGKISIAENIIGSAGYKLTTKNYPSLYDLTHFENLFFGQVSTFFETKTGLFLDVALGNKNYSMVETVGSTMGGKGMGMGKGAAMNIIRNESNVNITQLRSSLKISQSIFENTGIAAYYLNRTNLNNSGQNLQSTDFIYSDDQDLWDDPYGFQSNEYGAELTQKLPLDFTLKINGSYSRRHFTSNLADTLNLTQRIDGKTEMWFGVSKIFNSVPLFKSLEITAEYMLINNDSNMSLFNYKNKMAQFGFQLEL